MHHDLRDRGGEGGEQMKEFVQNDGNGGTRKTVSDGVEKPDVPGYGVSDD